MKVLDKEQVLKDIEPFKEEWLAEKEDWWFGSETSYENAELGYDVNIVNNVAHIYPLFEENGVLYPSSSSIFTFEMEEQKNGNTSSNY